MEIRNNHNLSDAKLLERQIALYDKMTEAQKNSPMGVFTKSVIDELKKKLN